MTIPLRSRATGSAIGLALALSVSGCSVHPLPDDLSPASTVDIVKRIRCEAWEGMTGFRPHEREKVDKIIGATKIGYDVVFSITEQNAAGGGKLEFDRPSFKGKGNGLSLDLSASADASRTNKRSFRFVDKLSELKTEGEKSCRGPATAANLLYPITGATGMGELVRTYIKLEILTDLGSEKSEVFSDELRFITNLRAGALPTLELTTVAGDFRLSHTSIGGAVRRDDTHTLVVALTRGPGDPDLPTLLAQLEANENLADTVSRSRTLRRILINKGSADTRILYELQRRRNARQDERLVSKVLLGTD